MSKHPSQLACVVRYDWQQKSHTLHVCRTEPHAAVPLSCPQLCGVTHVHASMQDRAHEAELAISDFSHGCFDPVQTPIRPLTRSRPDKTTLSPIQKIT